MSVSTEVQRTLVKSPPELWSELSDPQALARHLADLGEIRITGVEPETKVEWVAEDASGVVELKQSGWGTKVTLSVTRGTPATETTAEPESESEPEPEAPTEVEPETEPIVEAPAEPEPETAIEAKVPAEPEPVLGADPAPTIPQAEPKRGFFARLFKRWQPVLLESEPEAEPEPEPEPEIHALALPEPIYPEPIEPVEQAPDLTSELADVEAQMEQETTELLTGVLDRLGAAHHRPFSRG